MPRSIRPNAELRSAPARPQRPGSAPAGPDLSPGIVDRLLDRRPGLIGHKRRRAQMVRVEIVSQWAPSVDPRFHSEEAADLKNGGPRYSLRLFLLQVIRRASNACALTGTRQNPATRVRKGHLPLSYSEEEPQRRANCPHLCATRCPRVAARDRRPSTARACASRPALGRIPPDVEVRGELSTQIVRRDGSRRNHQARRKIQLAEHAWRNEPEL
jgi:hypothetical protein